MHQTLEKFADSEGTLLVDLASLQKGSQISIFKNDFLIYTTALDNKNTCIG